MTGRGLRLTSPLLPPRRPPGPVGRHRGGPSPGKGRPVTAQPDETAIFLGSRPGAAGGFGIRISRIPSL